MSHSRGVQSLVPYSVLSRAFEQTYSLITSHHQKGRGNLQACSSSSPVNCSKQDSNPDRTMEDGAIFKLFRCYTDLIVTVPAVGTHTLLMLPADKSFIVFSFFWSRTTQGAKNPKYDTYTSNGAGNSQMLLDCHTEWKWNIKFLFCFQLSKTQWSLRFCIFSDAMKQNHINGKDTETYLVKSLITYFLATLGETSCKHNTDMLLSFTVRWYGELVSMQVSIDTFNW